MDNDASVSAEVSLSIPPKHKTNFYGNFRFWITIGQWFRMYGEIDD